MHGLSVLIFSKDHTENTLAVIRDVYRIADEILLFDASKESDRKILERRKRLDRLGKLRIAQMVALGYPDMLRMYGLKKCRYDWVLLIDTDELLSEGLKEKMPGLIGSGCSAYALRRYEEVREKDNLPLFSTWQIRLFRKDAVEFRGIPHEQPRVRGKLERLDDRDCYMMHMSSMMSRKTQFEYGEMEKFERLTYSMHREKMLNYMSKAMTRENVDIKDTMMGKVFSGWMRFYQAIIFKRDDQELTDFDYFMHYATLDLAYFTLEGNLKGILGIIPNENRHVKQINRWQRQKDGQRILEISKIINNIGITRFLHLDDEKEINRLIRKYGYKDGGIKLLLKLINDEYEKERRTG